MHSYGLVSKEISTYAPAAHAIYRTLNTVNVLPNLRPRRRAQHQNGQATSRKVLLMTQVLIGRDKEIITCLLSSREQLTVLER